MRSARPIHFFGHRLCSYSNVQLNGLHSISQNMLRFLRWHLFWKTSSLWIMVLVIFQDSAPYRSVHKMLLLNSLILVLVVMSLHLHVLRGIIAKAWLAGFDILDLFLFFASPLVVVLDPKYMNSSTSSTSSPFSLTVVSILLCIPKIFLVLIFSVISLDFLVMSSILACI